MQDTDSCPDKVARERLQVACMMVIVLLLLLMLLMVLLLLGGVLSRSLNEMRILSL
jgi:hypothetical protein